MAAIASLTLVFASAHAIAHVDGDAECAICKSESSGSGKLPAPAPYALSAPASIGGDWPVVQSGRAEPRRLDTIRSRGPPAAPRTI